MLGSLQANKCILRVTALFTNNDKRAFIITFRYIVLFLRRKYDNLAT